MIATFPTLIGLVSRCLRLFLLRRTSRRESERVLIGGGCRSRYGRSSICRWHSKGGFVAVREHYPQNARNSLGNFQPLLCCLCDIGRLCQDFSGSSNAPTFRPLCGQLELEWPADLHFKQAFLEPGQEQMTGSSSRILKVTGASSLPSLGRRRSKSHRLVNQDLPRNL